MNNLSPKSDAHSGDSYTVPRLISRHSRPICCNLYLTVNPSTRQLDSLNESRNPLILRNTRFARGGSERLIGGESERLIRSPLPQKGAYISRPLPPNTLYKVRYNERELEGDKPPLNRLSLVASLEKAARKLVRGLTASPVLTFARFCSLLIQIGQLVRQSASQLERMAE